MTIKLKSTGWDLGGKHLPWIWGQINYWDIDRADWPTVLRAYHQAGHAVVSLAVLPSVHQRENGKFDFGEKHPGLDLSAFLDEIERAKLKAVIWVGPREVPGVAAAGYPLALLLDEAALARGPENQLVLSNLGPNGEVFSLPGLASKAMTQSLEPFAEAWRSTVSAHRHPDGPVIGFGLTLAPGWEPALSAYAADYSAPALAQYREGLKKRYGKISFLNQAYGTAYSAFQELDPPRGLETSGPAPSTWQQDWARAREEYWVRAAEASYGLFFPEKFQTLPVFLAVPPVAGRPLNLSELERSRCFDYLMPDRPIAGPGTAPDHWLPTTRWLTNYRTRWTFDPDDDESDLLSDLSAGYRGWESQSPCGSGRFPGFVTDRRGVLHRPRQVQWDTLLEMAKTEGLLMSQRHHDLVLLTAPEMERSQYLQRPPALRTDLLNQALRSTETVPLDPTTQTYWDQYRSVQGFLRQQQYAFLSFSAEGSHDRLRRGQVLVALLSSALSLETQSWLAQAVDQGFQMLLIGPMPSIPEGGSPLLPLLEVKVKRTGGRSDPNKLQGKAYPLPVWDEARGARLLKQIGVTRVLTLDDPRVELSVHKSRGRTFIAANNPCEAEIETLARREGKFVLKDFWDASKFYGGTNEIKVTLAPGVIKFWELIAC